MSRRTTQVAVLLLGLVGALSAQTPGDDPARLAPGDTSTYIQINGPASLRTEFKDQPFVHVMFGAGAGRDEEAWRQLETALGLNREQFFDKYFGRRVAFISTGDRHDGVVVSLVPQPEADRAIKALALVKFGELGSWNIYRTHDGHGRVAFGGGWMILGPLEGAAFDRVLQVAIATPPREKSTPHRSAERINR
jgi:hypothetical protein